MSVKGLLMISNLEQRTNYLRCWELNNKWVKDIKELEHLYRYNDKDDDMEDLTKLTKKTYSIRDAFLQKYIDKYAKYGIGYGFQVVIENRVLGLCYIESINIVPESKLGELRKPQYDIISGIIILEKNEFYYSLTYVNGITKAFEVIPTPKKMYSRCPICETPNKPLIDVIIGGEEKVSCADCYDILSEMFGIRHVKNELKLDDLYNLPIYKVISKISREK